MTGEGCASRVTENSIIEERIKNYTHHPSQRGKFGFELYKQMAKNENVWLILPDLGYKLFDPHCADFPGRIVKTGASEQGAMGVAIGLAMKGKIPFIFSITNFVIYRPYEWIRNYIDHEEIPVKILGGGRDLDYADDSFTHTCEELKTVLSAFPKLVQFWPQNNEEIETMCEEMVTNNKPSFISLTRK